MENTMQTILIAEDNRVNQRILMFILRKEGYNVITALHGKEALENMEQNNVDLVIADIEMPEMDGVTLVKQLRADARYAKLPVIILTASAENEDHSTAMAAGADSVLTKPSSTRELVSAVSNVLNS
jgi:CheY-like chemotaxis protein